MGPTWEVVESGPAGAERTVLLLPGGMCSARSDGAGGLFRVRVVTVPGKVFFLPNEVPERIADVIAQALVED